MENYFRKFKKTAAYPWLVWLLGSLFMFYKFAIEVSPSVMTTNLMSAFKIDGAALGNLAACYFYSYLLFQIPGGLLLDRFGPRRVTTIAIALCGLGALIFAYSETLFMAGFGRFLSGLGAAFAAVNCLKLTANWFPKNKFALMAGLMMAVGMLGAVGGQAPLSAFIHQVGWRPSMLYIGFSGLVLAAIFWVLVRDRAEYHFDVHVAPKFTSILKELKEIFKQKQSWILSVYSGLAFAPVSVFGGLWGVPFLMQAQNLSHTNAAHQVSLVFIGFAIGAPFWGWLSDYIKQRKPVMALGTIVACVSMACVIYLPMLPVWLLSGLLLFFGLMISAFLLSFTMITEINKPILAATAIGFMNTFDALIGALSDPLTGKVLDLSWQGEMLNGARVFPIEAFRISLAILPVYLIVSFVLIAFIRETLHKDAYPTSLP